MRSTARAPLCAFLALLFCPSRQSQTFTDAAPSLPARRFGFNGMSLSMHALPSPSEEVRQKRVRHRRRLNHEDLPFGIGTGTHYVNAYIGTPPQKASLIVDTGSAKTAFPCTGCEGCGAHTDAYFDPAKSSTADIITCDEGCRFGVASASCSGGLCRMSQSYLEGSSWWGELTSDYIYLGAKDDFTGYDNRRKRTKAAFGCDRRVTGLFVTQISNGIMGFSKGSNTYVSQLVADKQLARHVFSMCMSRNGGDLVLGHEYFAGRHAGESNQVKPMVYTQLQSSNSMWYRVQVKALKICPQSGTCGQFSSNELSKVNAGSQGVIVDSGTTDVWLPRSLAPTFAKHFSKFSNGKTYRGGNSYRLTYAELQSLPTFDVAMPNVVAGEADLVLKITSAMYMEPTTKGSTATQIYHSRIYLEDYGGMVIGAHGMLGHSVVFDKHNNRIGFAPSACDQGHTHAQNQQPQGVQVRVAVGGVSEADLVSGTALEKEQKREVLSAGLAAAIDGVDKEQVRVQQIGETTYRRRLSLTRETETDGRRAMDTTSVNVVFEVAVKNTAADKAQQQADAAILKASIATVTAADIGNRIVDKAAAAGLTLLSALTIAEVSEVTVVTTTEAKRDFVPVFGGANSGGGEILGDDNPGTKQNTLHIVLGVTFAIMATCLVSLIIRHTVCAKRRPRMPPRDLSRLPGAGSNRDLGVHSGSESSMAVSQSQGYPMAVAVAVGQTVPVQQQQLEGQLQNAPGSRTGGLY